MALDLTQHPLFQRGGPSYHRANPSARRGRCNIQCNYCDRKFDCTNESRPGVTSGVL